MKSRTTIQPVPEVSSTPSDAEIARVARWCVENLSDSPRSFTTHVTRAVRGVDMKDAQCDSAFDGQQGVE